MQKETRLLLAELLTKNALGPRTIDNSLPRRASAANTLATAESESFSSSFWPACAAEEAEDGGSNRSANAARMLSTLRSAADDDELRIYLSIRAVRRLSKLQEQ